MFKTARSRFFVLMGVFVGVILMCVGTLAWSHDELGEFFATVVVMAVVVVLLTLSFKWVNRGD